MPGQTLMERVPGWMARQTVRVATACALLLAAASCTKDEPVSGTLLRARLQVDASLASAGEQLDVAASYQRQSGAPIPMASTRVAVSGPGAITVPLDLDLTACLNDPQRAGGENVCPVLVDAVLRDAALAMLDSTRVGPIAVSEGTNTPQLAPVRLQAAANLVLESGDDQLAWAGNPVHLPVVLRLTDRAGSPIVGRPVTVAAQGGGGTPVGAPFLTDADGRVTIGYRVGTAPGANIVRASVALGSASLATTLTFTSVPIRRSRVSAGVFHSCAIFPDNVTRCWGSNDFGWVGNRAVRVPGDTLFPVPISGGATLVALATSKANYIYAGPTCGLTSAGAILCWGPSPSGEFGVAATDSCTNSTGSVSIPCWRDPQTVSGGLTFAAFDVGGNTFQLSQNRVPSRICGVTTSGDAYCWGDNTLGALGDSTTTLRTTPTRVGATEKWIDISTGMEHSCGVTVRGEAWCWGNNEFGGLGTGDTVSSPVPRRVLSPERFASIDVGAVSTCALSVDGAPRCWGKPLNAGVTDQIVPDTDPPDELLTRLTVGLSHACGVTATGAAYCQGPSINGRLGDGTPASTGSNSTQYGRQVATTVPLADVDAGLLHSCALSTAGDPYCWGAGSRGEIGSGVRAIAIVPIKVTTTPVTVGAPARILSASRLPQKWVRGLACPATSGQPLLAAVLLDANGYFVQGATLQFFARTPGAAVSQATVVTGPNGQAATGCTLSTTVGPNVFVVRSPQLPNDSLVVTVDGAVPGPAAQVSCLVCSRGATVGTTVNPVALQSLLVLVGDTAGLPVAGVPVTFTKPSPSGAIITPTLPTTVLTNQFGTAALTSWRADTVARADTVIAVASGFPNDPQRLVVTSLPDTAVALAFTVQPPDTIRAAQVIPTVEVALIDRYGNVATGGPQRLITLTLTGDDANQVLQGTLSVTTVGGRARFTDLRVNIPGLGINLVADAAPFQTIFSNLVDVIP